MTTGEPTNWEFEFKGIKGVAVLVFPDAPVLDNDHVEETGDRLFKVAESLHGQTLVLNFSRVAYISSRALGVLVSLYKKLLNRQKKLAVCCLSAELQEFFRIVHLEHLFPAYEDEGKAIAAHKVEAT